MKTGKYLFFLSCLNVPLAREEALAIIESETGEYPAFESMERVLIVENVMEKTAREVVERSAFTKWAGKLILSIDYEHRDEICKAVKAIDETLLAQDPGKTFCVRVKGIGVKDAYIEGDIGYIIKSKTGQRVNLENPDIIYAGVLMPSRFFLTLQVKPYTKPDIGARALKYRVFPHPSSLDPRLARAMVNLSRARKGCKFLDCFCGAGGVLLEAYLMGCIAYGIDIKLKMLIGCAMNLFQYSSHAFTILGDARNLMVREKSIDAIATDPPYGRSTFLPSDLKDLLSETISQSYDVLKDKRFMCFGAPIDAKAEDLVSKREFEILTRIPFRVHKSLTRVFYVLRKR